MGALSGIRIVEFAGIGPGPFCCMLLSDMGAEVIRIDRSALVGRQTQDPKFDPMLRGRKSIALDLKDERGVEVALKLCDRADILIECFRPGVMERLGLGPDVVSKRNSGLVYGRMTGWGQEGPLADQPGHDLNYIALTGALHAIGIRERPIPPLVLAGDFGGGGMYLALGVLGAYISAQRTGQGQVVDAAVVDGSASLMTAFFGMLAAGKHEETRASNRLDGGSHFYNVYETSDQNFVSVAPTEPKFFANLMRELNLETSDFDQANQDNWRKYKEQLAVIFKTKTRDEWEEILADKDACLAPVLPMSEAADHPHNVARKNFIEVCGVKQPAPAPKFSRTPSVVQSPPVHTGQHTRQILDELNYSDKEINELTSNNVAQQL